MDITPKVSKLDEQWNKWHTSGSDTDFNDLMKATEPIVSSAVNTYVPNAPSPIKSKAKVLTARALRTYDASKGGQLKTHLFNQLKPLYREMGDYSSVRAPERVTLDINRLNAMEEDYANEFGNQPSDGELADFTGLSLKRIKHIRAYNRGTMNESRLTTGADSAGNTALETTASEEAADLWESFVYNELSDTDKLIYDMRVGRNNRKKSNVAEISKKVKLSPGAVSQHLAKIAEKISEGKQLEQIYSV